ncbi:MAG: HlyD family efflux transporter periplasmic adaptor subunit [Smithellaceae bacterium]|nr:HlyD family efflux transporter periplasmic adaptor subunit [Smithellaceae bacterium]
MKVPIRRNLFVIAIILVVVGATVYGFIPKAVEVDLALVSRGPLQVTIEEEGRTHVKERFVISSPTAGYLRRLNLKAGDPVKKGQLVLALEPLRSQALDPRSRAEAEAAVSAAEAALAAARERERAAQADADYLEKRLERIGNLYAKGHVAKDQFDQTEAEAKKARAVQRSAKAAVEVARFDLERVKRTLQHVAPEGRAEKSDTLNVSSPIDGSVLRIYRESEGAVQPGEPLLEIGNARKLEVRVEVLSADAVRIKKGTALLFKRWGGNGTLTGVVRVVEPAGFTKVSSLGVEEQRVLVIADLTSPPQAWAVLGDGYRLEAHFIVWEGKDLLLVPASALFRAGKE